MENVIIFYGYAFFFVITTTSQYNVLLKSFEYVWLRFINSSCAIICFADESSIVYKRKIVLSSSTENVL